MAKPKENTNIELFAIHYNGKPLHMIREKWEEWKPAKKVYYTESAAKRGMNYVPLMIKGSCEIVRYIPESKFF